MLPSHMNLFCREGELVFKSHPPGPTFASPQTSRSTVGLPSCHALAAANWADGSGPHPRSLSASCSVGGAGRAAGPRASPVFCSCHVHAQPHFASISLLRVSSQHVSGVPYSGAKTTCMCVHPHVHVLPSQVVGSFTVAGAAGSGYRHRPGVQHCTKGKGDT